VYCHKGKHHEEVRPVRPVRWSALAYACLRKRQRIVPRTPDRSPATPHPARIWGVVLRQSPSTSRPFIPPPQSLTFEKMSHFDPTLQSPSLNGRIRQGRLTVSRYACERVQYTGANPKYIQGSSVPRFSKGQETRLITGSWILPYVTSNRKAQENS
jgi:hypothetical protein